MNTTVWIVLGPPEHGVALLAHKICRLMRGDSAVVSARNAEQLLGSGVLEAQLGSSMTPANAHVHFTDQLFGTDCGQAAAAYSRLAEAVARLGCGELSVTLHDLPTPADEPGRYLRRADAYRRVTRATGGAVIVSSAHEAELLAAIAPGFMPHVIGLPLQASRPARVAASSGDVAILGFIHPSSGHADVLEALVSLPDDVGLTALGRAADHHESVGVGLARHAEELGRRFAITGWIDAAELPHTLRQAGIPIVGPRLISASASIGSWLEAGRRPLVPDGPYTQELAARIPGGLSRYEPSPDGLIRALREAQANPAGSWLGPEVVLGPSSQQVADRYRSAVLSSRAATSR